MYDNIIIKGTKIIKYTGEYLEYEGQKYAVVDIAKLDFSEAQVGVKSKLTKVICAKDGENITTSNEESEVESVVVAWKGNAIFWNNEHDIYIPTDRDGKHLKFSKIESHGYSIQERGESHLKVRSGNKALLLVECVDRSCVILNVFGEGNHQYLYSGATIKKDIKTGNISGNDKVAYEKTRAILSKEKETF